MPAIKTIRSDAAVEVLREMGYNPDLIIDDTISIDGFDTYQQGQRGHYTWTRLAFDEFQDRLSKKRDEKRANDPVSHPSHYTSGKIEVIDFIEDQGLGFHEGNVVKYVARAGKKDPTKLIQDLKKAQWYLGRRIQKLEEEADE